MDNAKIINLKMRLTCTRKTYTSIPSFTPILKCLDRSHMAQSFLVRAILIRTFFVFLCYFFCFIFHSQNYSIMLNILYCLLSISTILSLIIQKNALSILYPPNKKHALTQTLKIKCCFYYYLSVCLDDHICDI